METVSEWTHMYIEDWKVNQYCGRLNTALYRGIAAGRPLTHLVFEQVGLNVRFVKQEGASFDQSELRGTIEVILGDGAGHYLGFIPIGDGRVRIFDPSAGGGEFDTSLRNKRQIDNYFMNRGPGAATEWWALPDGANPIQDPGDGDSWCQTWSLMFVCSEKRLQDYVTQTAPIEDFDGKANGIELAVTYFCHKIRLPIPHLVRKYFRSLYVAAHDDPFVVAARQLQY